MNYDGENLFVGHRGHALSVPIVMICSAGGDKEADKDPGDRHIFTFCTHAIDFVSHLSVHFWGSEIVELVVCDSWQVVNWSSVHCWC
jgi:hypothetical protein